MVSDKYVYVSF